jgi:competence protein ComGC
VQRADKPEFVGASPAGEEKIMVGASHAREKEIIVGASHAREKGFTLFEMVVVICSIVILYMVAVQRLDQIPAAAERAGFYGMLSQIRGAVQLEMMSSLASGRQNELIAMEGTNPMAFFLELPSNYRGELEEVTDRNVERGNWYFETSTGQLVYVVGGRSIADVEVTIGGIPVNYGQIRWRLENVYDERDQDQGDTARNRWQGLLLQEVYPFTWQSRPEAPIEI